jgi:hypothetical protein
MLCLALPVLWLVWTTPIDGGRAVMLIGGGLASAGLVIGAAWRAHHAGFLLPNRCATCEHPMCYTRPGEVKPPPGSAVNKERFWRCRHCGRLL